jgi:hypothetical protein
MEYTRKDLIQICLDGVIHHTKWRNRDSYSAQVQLNDIYNALTANIEYTYRVEYETIWIDFEKASYGDLSDGSYLNISDIEDYFNDCDPERETEMFNSNGIDFQSNYRGGYMPTRKKLDVIEGDDWY